MAILTKETRKNSHWYTRDGLAMHEVRRKETGPNGEETRPTTITDARLLNLFPSVTGILDIFNKPQLETWKINQAIYATLRFPKQEAESDEYYAKRVRESANEQVEVAADLGSAIHRSLELVLEDGTMERCEPEVITYVQPVLNWFSSKPFTILYREKVVVNLQDGFAGTSDLGCSFIAPDGQEARLVIDWKTRRTKPGVEVKAYDFQSWQIAAYGRTEYADFFTAGRVYGINLFISSTQPGRIEYVKYLPEQLISDYNCYRAAALIWRQMKDYDPRNVPILTNEEAAKAAALLPVSSVDIQQGGYIVNPGVVPSIPGIPVAPVIPAQPILAPTTVSTPLPVQAPAAPVEPTAPPAKEKKKRRTKAEMDIARTAAAMGTTAEPVNPPEVKPDIPPPVQAGPPAPGSDGQVAISINNWETPFVRVQCVFVAFCGIMLAQHRPIKPKDRPPVLLENDWTLSCPVTGLNVISHEKVKGKGRSREEWLQMAIAVCLVSGGTEDDIAATYKAAIEDKTPAPPVNQVTFLVQ